MEKENTNKTNNIRNCNKLEKITNNSFNYAETFLEDFCNQNSIIINEEIKQNLRKYYNLLIDWNEKINLTAITEINDVYEKHFADSVVGVNYVKNNSTLCDIGTGAGFPGLVIAIFRADINVVLVDALQKRVNFLNDVVNNLNLKNVKVLHNRAEDVNLKNTYLNKFDYVVARAVAKLNTLTEYCLPYVKVGGEFIAYKSEKTEEEISECENALKQLRGKNIKVENYLINNLYRTLVFFKKEKETSSKYPRSQNKPRTNPL